MTENFDITTLPDAFNRIDIYFAAMMKKLCGNNLSANLFITFALTSYMTTHKKHVCLYLPSLAGVSLKTLLELEHQDEVYADFELPDNLDGWLDELLATPVVTTPEGLSADSPTPLVLDPQTKRLYLYKYWCYEQDLGRQILAVIQHATPKIMADTFKEQLAAYFSFIQSKFSNFQLNSWQKAAIYMAVKQNFCVISGGPGTGKTTVAAAILSILGSRQRDDKKLTVSLCAPTGKAAARLSESITQNSSPQFISKLDICSSTIHRLLGYKHNSPFFKHNKEHPLPADILLVDEASMVPLTLMTKLLAAVKAGCKVILLGDKNQLASVESGAVMADISDLSPENMFSGQFITEARSYLGDATIPDSAINQTPSRFSDHMVVLKDSFRFDSSKGIGEVSRFINCSDSDAAWQALRDSKNSNEISWATISKPSLNRDLQALVTPTSTVPSAFLAYMTAPSVEKAFTLFNRFRVLCSHRNGDFGVKQINDLMTGFALNYLATLADQAVNTPTLFKGLPIMITENDHSLELYNGDIGLIWPDQTGTLKAFFPNPKAVSDQHAPPFIGYTPARLANYDTAFAITVHKSQGSGFRNVLIILPNEEDSPILTRELIYTAITRAEKHAAIWCHEAVFKAAVRHKTERGSGLKECLNTLA